MLTIEGSWQFSCDNYKYNTWCRLSVLPNGDVRGELLLVSAGLIASADPSCFRLNFDFRNWAPATEAFRPTNQTSASSLSLHICKHIAITHQYGVSNLSKAPPLHHLHHRTHQTVHQFEKQRTNQKQSTIHSHTFLRHSPDPGTVPHWSESVKKTGTPSPASGNVKKLAVVADNQVR